MLRRIAAAIGHVDAADKGERIVDDDDLLVMRGIEGVRGIELDADARMLLPGRAEQERHHRARRMQNRDAPDEHAHFETRMLLDETAQQVAELWSVIGQPDRVVEIPADDHDRAAGATERLFEMAEIIEAVDDHRRPRRGFAAPGIAAGREQARGRRAPPHRLRFIGRLGDGAARAHGHGHGQLRSNPLSAPSPSMASVSAANSSTSGARSRETSRATSSARAQRRRRRSDSGQAAASSATPSG